MRKPGDKIWHMQNNKPETGVIYFMESYLDNEKNPDKQHDNNADYYKLTKNIKNVYYVVSESDIENVSPTDLRDRATIRYDDQVFDTLQELVDNLILTYRGV